MDLRYLLTVDDLGTPSIKKFDSAIDKSADNTKKASKKIGKAFRAIGNAGKKAAKAIGLVAIAAVALASFALFKLGKASLKLASDFAEVEQKFNVVFKSIQDEANKTADNLAENFGLSNKAAKQLLGGTGDLLTGFGFADKAALDLSNKVQELAVDLASFNNLQGGATRASEILTKALLGERDSLIAVGAKILEADLQQRLLINGTNKLTGVALLAAKAEATFALILEQTIKAQDDFARSSGSLENQQKTLASRIEDLQVAIGKNLIPVMQGFTAQLIKVANRSTKWIKANDKLVKSGVVEFAKLFANAVFFIADAVLFAIKKFNFFLAGLKFLKAALIDLKIIILTFARIVLLSFSEIGKSIVQFFQDPIDTIKRQFIKFSLFINRQLLKAAKFGKAVLPEGTVDFVRRNVKTLEFQLGKMGEAASDGTNAVSTAFEKMALGIDANIAISKKQVKENIKSGVSYFKLGESTDKFREKLSSLNDEVIKNIDLTSKTPDKVVAAKSANIPSTDPKFIQQQLAAERAAAAEAAKIEDERKKKIFESAKEISAFLSTENELRFAEIEANSTKQLQAADFLRSQDLTGILEHEEIKNEIRLQSQLQRDAVQVEIEQREFDRTVAVREQELQSLLSHEQALFDASAGGLFARNAQFVRANQERLKASSKIVAAEQNVEKKKSVALRVGAQQLGAALLSIAQTSGGKLFQIAKAFAIAEAVINTFRAVNAALAAPPGPPHTIPAAIAAGVFGFAQVASIQATSAGGGAGGAVGAGSISGGGGSPGSAPGPDPFATPVLPETTENQQQLVINITGSFIGNEAELASKLAEIIQDASDDDVDFGLTVRGS